MSMNSTKDYLKINSKENRIALKKRNLYRDITHEDYEQNEVKEVVDGEKGFYRKILFVKPEKLSDKQFRKDDDRKYKERYRADDEYWEKRTFSYMAPRIYGGWSLFFTLGISIIYTIGLDKVHWYYVLFLIVTSLLSILHITYYITMPKNKEHIMDRKKGRITFPSSFWDPNITMSFDKLKFFKPGGGTNAIAAPGIKIVNTKKFRAPFTFSLNTSNGTDDMTLLTWYMDRNRPLPPVERFESYRQQDFERRKAEGFPPPLYPAFFVTPEDTPEQQAERNKYWVERVGREEGGSLYTEIIRGENEIFDMKTREWVKKG